MDDCPTSCELLRAATRVSGPPESKREGNGATQALDFVFLAHPWATRDGGAASALAAAAAAHRGIDLGPVQRLALAFCYFNAAPNAQHATTLAARLPLA